LILQDTRGHRRRKKEAKTDDRRYLPGGFSAIVLPSSWAFEALFHHSPQFDEDHYDASFSHLGGEKEAENLLDRRSKKEKVESHQRIHSGLNLQLTGHLPFQLWLSP